MPTENHSMLAVAHASSDADRDRWEPPTVEVICLACEISAYAPDGDVPLF